MNAAGTALGTRRQSFWTLELTDQIRLPFGTLGIGRCACREVAHRNLPHSPSLALYHYLELLVSRLSYRTAVTVLVEVEVQS